MEYSSLPKDPMVLLSFINTKLRDDYPSFDELCSSLCVDADDIKKKLATIDYSYDEKRTDLCKSKSVLLSYVIQRLRHSSPY